MHTITTCSRVIKANVKLEIEEMSDRSFTKDSVAYSKKWSTLPIHKVVYNNVIKSQTAAVQ